MQGGTDMTSDNIGDALLARRKQRRLDQGRAAAEIGVSPSTYRSYEKNTQRPSVNVFPSLSKFLGLEIEDFLPLYAATVIFALRPALERELASQGNGSSGDGAYVREVEYAPTPAPEDHVDDEPAYVAEVDDDEFFGEETSHSDLGSVDEQVFIAVEEPSTNGDFVGEVVDVEEVDEDEDDEDDEDEDEEDDEDDDDVESELVSVMAREEVMATPSVSQFTSMPDDFQKSTKQKKKKKKNKKR
jgi:transcriptional regulator with XRE-family HTH domain